MRLIPLFLLCGCVGDPWTKADTGWQIAYLVTVVADANMTTKIQDHPNIVESGRIANQFLGDNPSTSDTWMYLSTVAISHYLIARMLPEGWRRVWQGVGIYRHGNAVHNGYNLGLFEEPCTVNACE